MKLLFSSLFCDKIKCDILQITILWIDVNLVLILNGTNLHLGAPNGTFKMQAERFSARTYW